MSEINWKNKYEALKSKFMESVDTAFRLGYEQGAQEAQLDSMVQQQQQQADEMAAQGAPGQEQPGGEENGEAAPGEQVPSDSANPAGSELDQHIATLEGMLGKSENISSADLFKVTSQMKQAVELKKSAAAIPHIARNLHKPAFKLSQQANHNLSNNAKKAVSMQQGIVEDIMKSWEEETKTTGKDILSQLKAEGLIKE